MHENTELLDIARMSWAAVYIGLYYPFPCDFGKY